MAEELELPNREKCNALETELERSREDYFQLRRTVEKLKIEKDQMRAEHEQNMMEATEKHRAVENELNIRISALQVALEDTTEVEELHNLQRELTGSRLREKTLLQELAEVRTEKEVLRVAKERAAQDTREKIEEVQADQQRRDLQAEEMRRKVQHLERELHQEVEGHQVRPLSSLPPLRPPLARSVAAARQVHGSQIHVLFQSFSLMNVART